LAAAGQKDWLFFRFLGVSSHFTTQKVENRWVGKFLENQILGFVAKAVRGTDVEFFWCQGWIAQDTICVEAAAGARFFVMAYFFTAECSKKGVSLGLITNTK